MPRELMGLDDTELAILRELQKDARRSVVDIAKSLQLHRNTVRAKLKSLLDRRVVRPALYTSPAALGYRTVAVVGIKTLPGKMDAVADRLASLPNVHYVFACLGRYDVVIWCLFRDHEDLLSFEMQVLGNTPGVAGAEVMVSLGMNKVSFAFLDGPGRDGDHGDQEGGSRSSPPFGKTAPEPELSSLDIAIIRELQRDARQSARTLAKSLGVYRGVVAARLKRLSDEGTLRAVVAPGRRPFGYRVMVAIGVSVEPSAIKRASEALRVSPNIHSLTFCTGRYGILLWGFFLDEEELHDFLKSDLGRTPGIISFEVMVILILKKMSFSYLASG